MELSPNTKAILLLTAPLIAGKGERSARPLSAKDYWNLAHRLRDYGREPADLLRPEAGEILRESHSDFDLERINQLLGRGFLLSQAVENWQSRAIWVISRADASYPQQYKDLMGQNRPPVLYGCGAVSLLGNGGLAVVGSRQIAGDLVEFAENIGSLAAAAQCTVISGGAPGSDQSAMRGVLESGGTGVVVAPAKLENEVALREYRDALMDGRLALISPYDPKAGWSVGLAMGRNKLIYGLSQAALVVESSYNKGGTWPGAVEQLECLRFVPVYVRSTGKPSKGLEGLRSKGAFDWPDPRTPEEFLAVLANEPVSTERPASTETKEPQQPALSLFAERAGGPVAPAPAESAPESPALRSEPAETAAPATMSPGEALFDQVRQLLASIETPTTDHAVAEYLDVSKSQANDWLKRLVREGKYRQTTKPARYIRND